MRLRVVGTSILLLLACCSCTEKRHVAGGRNLAATSLVIQLSMDPGQPGQCLQKFGKMGDDPSTFKDAPTFVEVNQGDRIQWISISAVAGNTVFFPQVGSADFPGTPMLGRTWVFAFAYGNNPLATSAQLTRAELPDHHFTYSQVLVPDAMGHPVPCAYPDPIQGMGVHVTN